MRGLALLLSTLIGANAIVCPQSYSDGGDGSCYYNYSPTSRDNGYRLCASENSYLVDVPNAFQNSAVQQRAGYADFIWLGLTCLNNSVTSCEWDTGIPLTSSSYNNFNGGSPVVDDGPCVLMAVKTGKWYSADCSNYRAYIDCKYTPNIKVPFCDWSSFVFRGKCYLSITVNTATNAASYCTAYDSIQASIHSDGENAYIKGLGVNSGLNQLFVGIQQNGTWTDGTAVDYDNYGYKNTALGSCTSMSLYGELVPAGMWISSQCTSSSSAVTVCKREPFEPTQAPTLSPLQCSGTQFLSGYGTVYSPGYPRGSEPNHCEFLITEAEGYQAQLFLMDVQLDKNSALQLFSGLFDKTPFRNLTNTNISWQSLQSPTNVLKIIYDTAGSQNSNNVWALDYQPLNTATQAPIEATTEFYACGSVFLYSGEITSENFPRAYPQQTKNCSYNLQSHESRTCFKFDVFNIRYYDYVYLYDGDSSYNLLIASFTGYESGDGIYCTNLYNYMYLVFSTFSYNLGQVTGWSGRFAADSSLLVSTTPAYEDPL